MRLTVEIARRAAATEATRSSSRPNSRRRRAARGRSTSCRRAARRPTSSGSSRASAARVEMRMELVLRFDYGSIVPWVEPRRRARRPSPAPTPSACELRSSSRGGTCARSPSSGARGRSRPVRADLVPVARGSPEPVDAEEALADTVDTGPTGRGCAMDGRWRDAVSPLAHHAKGAHVRADGRDRGRGDDVVAEELGGVRNWDYRYCWLRDATLTLLALSSRIPGRSADVARMAVPRGRRAPVEIQIMYGVAASGV